MTNLTIDCASETETARFASMLGTLLAPGDCLALEGDLGAGKTTFTKALAGAIGVTRTVNSPTFTIMKQYQGRFPLYHFDVYRLTDEDEDLGFDEYFSGDGVCIIEWAHLIGSQLPPERLTITITRTGEVSRKIVCEPIGVHYQEFCTKLRGLLQ